MAHSRSGRAFTLLELLIVVAIIGILTSVLFPALARAKGSGHLAACSNNLRQIGIGASLYTTDHSAFVMHGTVPDDLQAPRTYWPELLQDYLAQDWIVGALYRCAGNRFQTNWPHDILGPGTSKVVGHYDMNAIGASVGDWQYPLMGLGLNSTTRPPPWFVPVRESEVFAPSEMLAYGDTARVGAPGGYIFSVLAYRGDNGPMTQESKRLEKRRHRGKYNTVFCDGHVEAQKPEDLFSLSPSRLKRWNKDNQVYPLPPIVR